MKNFDRNTHTPIRACTPIDSHQTYKNMRLWLSVLYSCNFFIFKYISCHKSAQNECLPPPMHSQGNTFDLHLGNPVYITATGWGWTSLEGWDWSKWKKQLLCFTLVWTQCDSDQNQSWISGRATNKLQQPSLNRIDWNYPLKKQEVNNQRLPETIRHKRDQEGGLKFTRKWAESITRRWETLR